ncbi:hypothetical protein GY45DRAFT_688079 [Cubamyces sp. BRFM 1775]|nr:hypothetical protein GY45DRAFT_688079 [Cubamyces sp. BRFM 1775]
MTSMAEYLKRVHKRHLAYQCWESSAERRALINSQQILLEALSISLTDFIRKVVRTTEHPEQYELPSFHTRTRARDWDRHDGQAVLPDGDEAWAPLETFLQKLDRRPERREVARRFMRHRSASPRIEHVSLGPAPQILITAPPEEPHSDAPSQVSSASTILNQESASSCGSQLLQPPPVSRGHRSSHNPLARVARPVSPSPRRSASPCPSPELLPSCPAKALGKRRAIDDGSPTPQRPRKRPKIARAESWSNSSDADVSAGESSNTEAPSPPPPAVPEDPPTPDSSTAVSSCGSERHPTSEASFPSRSSSLEVNVGDESARHAQYPCSTYTLATMSGPQDDDMDMDSTAEDEDAASYTTADDCLSIDEGQLLPSPPAPTPAPSSRAPARHSRFIGTRRCWDGVIQFVQEMLRF